MTAQKFIQLFVLVTILLVTVASANSTFAAGCGSSMTVVSGDTLRKIAARCGTTVSALRRANPEIGAGDLIYPNQVLQLPGSILATDGGYFIYIIARGDTLKGLATRFATTIDALLAANKDITNQNVIYEGQRLKVYVTPPPAAGGQLYYIKKGDTLKNIASRMGTTVDEILKVNLKITNPNLIYVGQAITLPTGISTYIVQKGDTLRIIANKFGTTVDSLLLLNPNIANPNLIYAGQIVNIR